MSLISVTSLLTYDMYASCIFHNNFTYLLIYDRCTTFIAVRFIAVWSVRYGVGFSSQFSRVIINSPHYQLSPRSPQPNRPTKVNCLAVLFKPIIHLFS